MWIVKNRKYFFAFSAILLALSIFAVVFFGVKLSIDFTGGQLYEVASKQELSKKVLSDATAKLNLSASIRETEINGFKSAFIVRTETLSDTQKKQLLDLFKKENLHIERESFVGPTVGSELKKKAVVAILLTVLAIIIFVAWAFKEVSKPVSSWKYGAVAILALLHDVLLPVGAFAVFGKFGAQIDTLFVMALLAILGYSVNDTIVIFDRVRERLKRNKEKKIKESFEETVGKALESTLVRSINTSLTTALVVLALFVWGAESTKFFALTLFVGILAGTYSSIFLAAPLLVEIAKWQKDEKAKAKSENG